VAGAAAGGAQGMLAAGTQSTFFVYSVLAGYLLSTFRANETVFWNIGVISNGRTDHPQNTQMSDKLQLVGLERSVL
jgi:hypothetical protein